MTRWLATALGVVVLAVRAATAAGNVSATTSGDQLTLDGDPAANQVAILPADGADAFIVMGMGDTLVNGAASASVNGVQRLTARMRGGADWVELTQVTLRGPAIVRLDAGNDALVLNQARIEGRLGVRGDEGGDTLTIDGGEIGGRVVARLGEGVDDVELTDATLQGRLTLATGPGNDRVVLEDVRAESDARVRIDTDSGDDRVRLFECGLRNRLFVNLGDDDDELRLDDVTADDEVDCRGGHGDDDTLILRGRLRFEAPSHVEFEQFERVD